jgi:hypothetical protein
MKGDYPGPKMTRKAIMAAPSPRARVEVLFVDPLPAPIGGTEPPRPTTP